MLKKIIITLLLISPIVLYALEVSIPRAKTAPPRALVGAWETEFKTRFGKSRVSFNLYEDGTVEGTVGDATMQNAYFKRNRGWLGRMLRHATDYIIVGDLNGSVIDEVQCGRFWIVGHFDEKGIRADIDCDGCRKGGEKQSRIGAGSLIYTRVEQP